MQHIIYNYYNFWLLSNRKTNQSSQRSCAHGLKKNHEITLGNMFQILYASSKYLGL